MKAIGLCIVGVALLCACSTNEDKAKDLIEQDLKTRIKDWKSYQFVEMTKLDTTYTSFTTTPEGKKFQERKNVLNRDINLLQRRIQASDTLGRKALAALQKDSLNKLIFQRDVVTGESLVAEQGYQGTFNGFRTRFRYYYMNEDSVRLLENRWYFFDKDLTRITKSFK